MKIAFLGNFRPSYSTESDLLWTFQDLGHTVMAFQEDVVPSEMIYEVARSADLFLWMHTWGWDMYDRGGLICALQAEVNCGATASFSLDLLRGLHREPLVTSHPFFKTQHFFGVDGRSHMDGWYKERGVNHHLILPGVVKRDCYLAEPKDEYRCDVGFVGSYEYHSEHTHRKQLVDWLRSTYGDRFKKFGNPEPTLRGHELNRFYASCKVVVGDTCNLPGNHHYFSDRMFETTGRGGALLMPFVPGMEEAMVDGEH